jgi:hypothetical protein
MMLLLLLFASAAAAAVVVVVVVDFNQDEYTDDDAYGHDDVEEVEDELHICHICDHMYRPRTVCVSQGHIRSSSGISPRNGTVCQYMLYLRKQSLMTI